MISFEVNQKIGTRINERSLKKILKKAEEILGLKDKYNFSFAIVKDIEIKKLNKIYRGKNIPTDVLAFNFIEPKKINKTKKTESADLGEVIISYETAARQARERGHSVQKEVQILFIHGLLHLLGYDHETEKEEEQMKIIEEKIIKTI